MPLRTLANLCLFVRQPFILPTTRCIVVLLFSEWKYAYTRVCLCLWVLWYSVCRFHRFLLCRIWWLRRFLIWHCVCIRLVTVTFLVCALKDEMWSRAKSISYDITMTIDMWIVCLFLTLKQDICLASLRFHLNRVVFGLLLENVGMCGIHFSRILHYSRFCFHISHWFYVLIRNDFTFQIILLNLKVAIVAWIVIRFEWNIQHIQMKGTIEKIFKHINQCYLEFTSD